MLSSAIPETIPSHLIRAVLLMAVCAAIVPSHAQSPAVGQAVNRADLLRTEPALREPYQGAPAPDGSYAPESPNDPDLGEQAILKRQDSYKAFTFASGIPVFYTSNVALSNTNEQGDVIFAPAVGFSYTPRIKPTLYANFSVGLQEFYYNDFTALDFGSFDARAGLTYLLPKLHDLSLHAEYAYNRLTTSNSFDEFFSSHGLGFTADLPFRIGRAQQFSVGVDAFINIHSAPAGPGRHDFDVYAAYAVNVARAVTLNAVGRVALRDYNDTNRTDVSEVLSLGATYRFGEWWSVAATGTFAHSDSNQDVFDYNVANVGGALSFAFRF
jgi:hypothetical protein